MMRTVWRNAAIAVVLCVGVGGSLPAHAHTNIVIVGFQIAPGGYVNGLGVAPNQDVRSASASPATDGTEVWTNLDPVAHQLVGRCIARPSTGLKLCVTSGPGQTRFAVTVDAGEMKELSGLPLGTYAYSDPAYPTMQAEFRVTSSE